MKQIINKKSYDTNRSYKIAAYWNGASTNDFNHLSEALYLTPRGNWFVAGEGGAMSKYGESCEGGNSRCGGSNIEPLTPEDALNWLEAHDETEAIEKHFGGEIKEA